MLRDRLIAIADLTVTTPGQHGPIRGRLRISVAALEMLGSLDSRPLLNAGAYEARQRPAVAALLAGDADARL